MRGELVPAVSRAGRRVIVAYSAKTHESMTQQAMRSPALPVVALAGTPPRRRSGWMLIPLGEGNKHRKGMEKKRGTCAHGSKNGKSVSV